MAIATLAVTHGLGRPRTRAPAIGRQLSNTTTYAWKMTIRPREPTRLPVMKKLQCSAAASLAAESQQG